jgi:hypothetical protein
MKRMLMILVMLLPLAAAAQEADSISMTVQTSNLGAVAQPASSWLGLVKLPPTPGRSSGVDYALGSGPSALDPQKREAPRRVAKRPEVSRPKTEGSMVGYIDDAIVGSQVRIRFDAAFNNDTPDLAEFFYAKCGCYRGLATVAPSLYDPNAPGPPPGNAIVIPRTLNFQQLSITTEYALRSRISVFADFPFRWLQAQGLTLGAPGSFPNQGGIGDVRAGVKVAVLASPNRYLTAQFKTYTHSGDASKGLGTHHWSIEPAVLYFQKLSDRATVEGQLGFWHPTGGSAGFPTAGPDKFSGNVFFYGVGPSYEVHRGDQVRFAPVLELVGWHISSGFVTAKPGPPSDASGINIVNLKVGFRTGIGRHNSIYAGFGHKLTKDDWYQDIIRVEYRYSF